MSHVVVRKLALELEDLHVNVRSIERPRVWFLHVLKWQYCPEEMSDCENQIVWTRLVLLSLRYGVTTVDYEQELNVMPFTLQQWANGVTMPQRVQIRKDLYRAIVALVRTKQSAA
jgi:hypothetical protein